MSPQLSSTMSRSSAMRRLVISWLSIVLLFILQPAVVFSAQPETSSQHSEKHEEDSDPQSKRFDPTMKAAGEAGGKKLSIPNITGSLAPRNDGFHDSDNEAIVILQDPAAAMAGFPRDRRQEVNWVQALDKGLIDPRADLLGKTQMKTLDMDILMKNTQFMPWVKFPHLQHTKWLACENCHPKIFEPKIDANPISMNKVLRGEYCGVCHDKVAFSLFVCERCHSVPHEGSGPKWW